MGDNMPVKNGLPEADKQQLKEELLTEQVRLAFGQTALGDIGLGLAASLVSYLLWDQVSHRVILIWLGIGWSFNLANLVVVWAFYRVKPPPGESRRWLGRWFIGMIADSLIWGLGVVLLFPASSQQLQMGLALVVIGIGLATTAAFSAIRWGPQISILLYSLPLAAMFWSRGDETGEILGLLMLVYIAVMVYFSHNFYRATTRSLSIGIENARLAASLSAELEEHARMQLALRESEEKFRSLVENAMDGIVLIQEETIIYANNAARKIVGLPADDVSLVNYTAFSPDEMAKSLLKERYRDQMEGEPLPPQFETKIRRVDGEVVDVIVASSVFSLDGKPKTIAMIKDMSEFKKIEAMKREFVAVVSHELKTPLTSIMASLQMLENDHFEALAEDAKSMIGIARQNSERLLRLADSLLAAHQLDFGLTRFEKIQLDLDTLVRSSVEQANQQFEEAGLTLEMEAPGSNLNVEADRDALIQVMSNLLTNAAKFSPAGGTVRVALTGGPDTVRVEVTDQGPGVPVHFRERVFEKFARAAPPREVDDHGSGLGLSICKSIIEAHQGKIGFEHPETGGVTFYFQLPSAAPRSAPG